MKFIFLIITLVPAVLCASIGIDERKAIMAKYITDCIMKSGVSRAALEKRSSLNYDRGYNDFLWCLTGKRLSDNTRSSAANSRAMNRTHNINLVVTTSYSRNCVRQSKISLTTVLHIVNEPPPEDDPDYRKLLSCNLVKLGILTVDGDIGDDATKVEKWLLTESGQNLLDWIKTDCGDKKGETLQDTAVLVVKCIEKHNAAQ